MNSLTIIEWNACSLNENRRLELKEKCNNMNIDVICVCEAKIEEPLKNFDNYIQFRNNDTVMLVKKELQCRVMKQYWIQEQHIETITLEISNIIMGVYCRDGSHRDGIVALMNLVKWIKEDNDNICIIGDLNAKAGMVYEVCGGRNAAGVELDKHLEQEVVYCINDETHTFFRSHCQSSLLDLCLVTEPVLGKLDSFSIQNCFP